MLSEPFGMEHPMLLGSSPQKKKPYGKYALAFLAVTVGVAVFGCAGYAVYNSTSSSEPSIQEMGKIAVADSVSVEGTEEDGSQDLVALRGISSAVVSAENDDDLQPIPAIQHSVGYGYDINSEEFKLPIVQLHYEDGETYYDAESGKTYKVPDEFSVRSAPGTHEEEEEKLFEHMHEYLEYKSSNWGVDVGLQYKMIEAKASFQRTKIHAEHLFESETHFFLYGEKRLQYYEVSLWPPQPHPKFQRLVDALPETFESDEDKQAYAQVIGYFGTHFCDKSMFGGMVNWTVSYDKTISERHTMDYTDTQLKVSVGVIKANLSIDGHAHWEHNETDIEKDFREHSKRASDSLGGSANIKEVGTFKEWIDTVPINPAPLPYKTHYQPISSLIKDATKKANMVTAIIAYANGELGGLQSNLEQVETPPLATLQAGPPQVANDDEDYPELESLHDGVGFSFDAVSEEYKFPVFKYNYDMKQLWTNPITKKTYKVPDELDIRNDPQMHEVKTQKSYDHMQYYMEEHVKNSYFGIGFDVGFFGLGFSLSKTKGELHEYFQQDTYAMVYGDRATTIYEVQAWPADLHPRVQRAVDALPEEYNEDAYLDFVETYGTHYAQQAKYGAAVNFTMLYDKTLWKKHDIEWSKKQCHIGIDVMGFDIGISTGGEHERKHYDMDFILHSKNITDSEGGKVNVKIVGNYTEWLNTAVDNPTALKKYTKYHPIYELVRDAARKNNIKKAIMAYGEKGPRALREQATAVAAPVDPDTLPAVAGTQHVGCGYDVTTLERKHCLTKLSYSHDPDCTDCVYSFPGYDGYDFKVPEQMIAQQTPESYVQNVCLIMKDVADYVKTVVHSESHRHGFLGMGKKTKTTYDFYHTYYEQSLERTLNFHYYSWYTLTMPTLPMPELDPRFEAAVARLPKELNEGTQDEYYNFFEQFGTHITTQAVMGGHINATTLYHKCFLGHFEEHWVTEQSSWSFAGIIGGGHGHTDGHKNVDEKFWEHQESHVDLIGGDPQYYKNITWWAEWVKTIKDNPVPVRQTVRPIVDFIPDATIKANLDTALGGYLQAAEDEAERIRKEMEARGDPSKEPDWCKPPAPPLL